MRISQDWSAGILAGKFPNPTNSPAGKDAGAPSASVKTASASSERTGGSRAGQCEQSRLAAEIRNSLVPLPSRGWKCPTTNSGVDLRQHAQASVAVWSDGHCPSCKKPVPMYEWVPDALKQPWKMRCPQCKELFPRTTSPGSIAQVWTTECLRSGTRRPLVALQHGKHHRTAILIHCTKFGWMMRWLRRRRKPGGLSTLISSSVNGSKRIRRRNPKSRSAYVATGDHRLRTQGGRLAGNALLIFIRRSTSGRGRDVMKARRARVTFLPGTMRVWSLRPRAGL